MAKKQNKVDFVEETVSTTIEKPVIKKNNDWVIKDRMYVLKRWIITINILSQNKSIYIGLMKKKVMKES